MMRMSTSAFNVIVCADVTRSRREYRSGLNRSSQANMRRDVRILLVGDGERVFAILRPR